MKLAYSGEQYTVITKLHGEHLALPALCALAVALAAGLTLHEAGANLQEVEPSEGRMQVVRGGDGVTFLRDDWKAPLWSLDAPMTFMQDATAPRKVMVIGTLSDYSRSASKLYPRVAERALEIADQVIFVGANAYRATKRATREQRQRLHGFGELREAAVFLRENLRRGDLVLLKGSSRMDHLVRLILDRENPIACWESRCGKTQFCTSCPRLYDFERASNVDPAMVRKTGDPPPVVAVGEECIVLVGLGNPGEEYRLTRHNAGHLVLDTLVHEHGMTWEHASSGQFAEGLLLGVRLLLVKPGASINHSGEAIRHMLGSEELRRAVVIHDDMDIELGKVKVGRGGGDGGHLGVRSIITVCQTQDFSRVKLGVRPQGDDRKSLQLVHDNFSDKELQQLTAAFSSSLPKLLSQVRGEALETLA